MYSPLRASRPLSMSPTLTSPLDVQRPMYSRVTAPWALLSFCSRERKALRSSEDLPCICWRVVVLSSVSIMVLGRDERRKCRTRELVKTIVLAKKSFDPLYRTRKRRRRKRITIVQERARPHPHVPVILPTTAFIKLTYSLTHTPHAVLSEAVIASAPTELRRKWRHSFARLIEPPTNNISWKEIPRYVPWYSCPRQPHAYTLVSYRILCSPIDNRSQ
jgi:hypothetical protein